MKCLKRGEGEDIVNIIPSCAEEKTIGEVVETTSPSIAVQESSAEIPTMPPGEPPRKKKENISYNKNCS